MSAAGSMINDLNATMNLSNGSSGSDGPERRGGGCRGFISKPPWDRNSGLALPTAGNAHWSKWQISRRVSESACADDGDDMPGYGAAGASAKRGRRPANARDLEHAFARGAETAMTMLGSGIAYEILQVGNGSILGLENLRA